MNLSQDQDCIHVQELLPDMIDQFSVKFLLSIFYWLTFILGLTGNIAAFFAILHYGPLRLLHGPYLLGLTISSLISTISGLPVTAIQLLTRSWAYGQTTCAVSSLFQSSSLFAISLILCAIALERYSIIVNPSRVNKYDRVKSISVMVFIAGVSLLLSFPYFYYVKTIDRLTDANDTIVFCVPICGENWPNYTMRCYYDMGVIFVQFCLPILVFSLCYGGIMRAVKKQMQKRLVHSILTEETTNSIQNRRKRLNRMMFSLILSFVLPWFVHNFLIVAQDFDFMKYLVQPEWNLTLINIGHCTAMTYCIWNPVVYALYHPDIRNNFEKARNNRRRSTINNSEVSRIGARKSSPFLENDLHTVSKIGDVQL